MSDKEEWIEVKDRLFRSLSFHTWEDVVSIVTDVSYRVEELVQSGMVDVAVVIDQPFYAEGDEKYLSIKYKRPATTKEKEANQKRREKARMKVALDKEKEKERKEKQERKELERLLKKYKSE